MSRKIVIGLNQDEISNLASELDKIAGKLEKMGEKVVEKVSDVALEEMQKNFNQSAYQPSDGMGFIQKGTAKEKEVGIVGSQAIYMEFGTGTYGKQNPHPQMGMYDLEGYNTGKTIRRNTNPNSIASQLGIPKNGLYWTYKDENGWIHYTQGIPAQKIVYDANKTVKEKLPTILKEAVEEVLK